ncbi:CBS domain-containing protein [Halovulum dunhuangense]|uniref:CBS domain-containing protein n=1 Tax=Halovulum dunhuangense TaxID=1505036 RepID=A0A849L382_9RHOB|nr:CBS domain-containing protein [Halovulum dunhuangense]NNU80759.1 CBS domain-containing protein [Halovulum dunhuangense]
MTVRQILKSKGSNAILTISPDATVAEAAMLLSEKRIGALIVSKDGESLDGMLSERDIVRELGRQGAQVMGALVSSLMTAKVITAAPDDVSVQVLEKMTRGRFRHLPVLEQGRMIGVISIGDVVKHRIDEVEAENTALTEMIVGHG